MQDPIPTLQLTLQKTLKDGPRRFELNIQLSTNARITALYGHSGAGKSLTLNAIAGLLTPDEGSIRFGEQLFFDSTSRTNLAPAHRHIGYLFQHYALFPHLTVRQNIEFGLTTWHKRRLTPQQQARVNHLIDNFGLRLMAHSRPAALSGGQQQRTALARALARQPRLLLLDEPFAALNPMLRHQLRSELADLCRQWNIPAVMITHDIDDVLALADRAFLYDQGRITDSIDLRSTNHAEARYRLTGLS